MKKITKLCCGGGCPTIIAPVIAEDASYGDKDYFTLKDNFGGKVKYNKEDLDKLRKYLNNL